MRPFHLGGDLEWNQNMLERLYIPSGLGSFQDPPERKTEGLLGCLASPAGAVIWVWASVLIKS